MNITAVTAPTRGPDYVAPAAPGGTPIVTAPQPAPTIAPESSFTAASLAGDTTTEGTRKKRLSPSIDVPPRYLTATRGAIVTALQDIPASHVSLRLAAQAYLSQGRAQNDTSSTSTRVTPETVTPNSADPAEHHAIPTMPPDLPLSLSSQRSESSTAGGLDVTA